MLDSPLIALSLKGGILW